MSKKVFTGYYRICFRQKARAYGKYKRLSRICEEAHDWLAASWRVGDRQTAIDIKLWMEGPGGFTRPHMPYFVIIDARTWDMLSRAIRRGEGSNADYCWVRSNGTWV